MNLDMVGEETINNSDFVVAILHKYRISIMMNKLVQRLGPVGETQIHHLVLKVFVC